MGAFIEGVVLGVVSLPLFWIFNILGGMMISQWKENPFAGIFGAAAFIVIPLNIADKNLPPSGYVGLIVGVVACWLWWTKAKRKDN